jgi:hypothetical protein
VNSPSSEEEFEKELQQREDDQIRAFESRFKELSSENNVIYRMKNSSSN